VLVPENALVTVLFVDPFGAQFCTVSTAANEIGVMECNSLQPVAAAAAAAPNFIGKPLKRPVARKVPSGGGAGPAGHRYCGIRPTSVRIFGPEVGPQRAALIQVVAQKWVNGTILHYAFLGGPPRQQAAVRRAFKVWMDVGIGLKFEEVTQVADAEVRIAFQTTGPDAGSWSYVGREILTIAQPTPTMNIGWDISNDLDTAIPEIGHTLGFPHEHQNPLAGIVWDEEAVYASLAQPPNSWDRSKTFENIIRKIAPDTVQGSNWDPNSIMHYPFEAGLIKQPAQYSAGLTPVGGLSARDLQWVKSFYPPLTKADYAKLVPFESQPFKIAAGKQANYLIEPTESRPYEMRTFGSSDSVMVLFEEDGKKMRYVAGDDDSGTDKNAQLRVPLAKGRRYVLRVRVMYAASAENSAIMLW